MYQVLLIVLTNDVFKRGKNGQSYRSPDQTIRPHELKFSVSPVFATYKNNNQKFVALTEKTSVASNINWEFQFKWGLVIVMLS